MPDYTVHTPFGEIAAFADFDEACSYAFDRSNRIDRRGQRMSVCHGKVELAGWRNGRTTRREFHELYLAEIHDTSNPDGLCELIRDYAIVVCGVPELGEIDYSESETRLLDAGKGEEARVFRAAIERWDAFTNKPMEARA